MPDRVRVANSEQIDIPELLPDSEIRLTRKVSGVFPAGRLSAEVVVNPQSQAAGQLESVSRPPPQGPPVVTPAGVRRLVLGEELAMRKRRAARAAALLTAAVVSAGVLVVVASPAQAASLGTITLSQTIGSVDDTPMFASGSTWSTGATPAEPTTTSLAITPAGLVDEGTEVTLTADVEPDAAAGTVEGETPPGASRQEVVADIAPGAFTVVLASPVVQLTGATVGGTATGDLPEAAVTDLRGSNAGWTLTGQQEDFDTTPVTTAIAASNLTWDPSASKTSGSGTVAAGETASLGEVRTLCSAAPSSSSGVFDCDAGLALAVPSTAAPGVYHATLTLTLA